MNLQLESFRDVGLQSLLENGLDILAHKPAEELRRVQVMEGLVSVFSEADRGSTVLRSQAGLWAAAETPAFERFSTFFRYLNDALGADALNQLSQAKHSLETLKAGGAVEHAAKEQVEHIIGLILSGLRRDRLSAPLIAPMEIKFS